jgi:hypothetical protein
LILERQKKIEFNRTRLSTKMMVGNSEKCLLEKLECANKRIDLNHLKRWYSENLKELSSKFLKHHIFIQ